jgi:hypothetical protein
MGQRDRNDRSHAPALQLPVLGNFGHQRREEMPVSVEGFDDDVDETGVHQRRNSIQRCLEVLDLSRKRRAEILKHFGCLFRIRLAKYDSSEESLNHFPRHREQREKHGCRECLNRKAASGKQHRDRNAEQTGQKSVRKESDECIQQHKSEILQQNQQR